MESAQERTLQLVTGTGLGFLPWGISPDVVIDVAMPSLFFFSYYLNIIISLSFPLVLDQSLCNYRTYSWASK